MTTRDPYDEPADQGAATPPRAESEHTVRPGQGRVTRAEAPPTGTPVASPPGAGSDPLRGSRTSGIWLAVAVLVLLLILLAIFVLQNTQSVEVSFLGWNGSAPLSASLLIAAVVGMVIAGTAGALRVLQLRRRVKRERKA